MKDLKFIHKALLLVNSLALTVTGCNLVKSQHEFPDDPRVDRSFVTGQPCEAPCWYELRLEESTIEDARTILTQLEFVDQPTLFEWPVGTDGSKLGIYFDCVYYNPPGTCGELVIENGRLAKVFTSVQSPLTLKAVIEKLNIPDFYTVDTSPTEDICFLDFYWLENDIIAGVEENSREKHCSVNKAEPIDLNLQVISLIYLKIDPNDQQNYEGRPWPNLQQ